MAYTNYYQGGYYPQYQNGAVPDMLNQYKGQYQQPQIQNQQPFCQPFGQPIQQPMTIQPQTNDMMIWVLSEGEAQSYPVAPNNSVILWDKNSDVVYIKSVNAQNVPSFRVLDYKERTADNAPKTPEKHECQCSSKFVSIDKFNALESKFDELRSELEALKEKPKAKTAKKVVEEVETDGE
jgi:hypothetical protein